MMFGINREIVPGVPPSPPEERYVVQDDKGLAGTVTFQEGCPTRAVEEQIMNSNAAGLMAGKLAYWADVLVPEERRGQNLGEKVWTDAEVEFQTVHPGVLRITTDESMTGWTQRHFQNVVKGLGENGLEVDILWQNQTQNPDTIVWTATKK
jgi:hypothetical protein